ncbi:unnamed protein product [Symbiodinium sp. CCMP2592]|nr:unnamed protein product [Symbiodinium sp. CCMP2592]
MPMTTEVQQAITQIKKDVQIPINTKWLQIRNHLMQAGLLYQLQVVPSSMLVHPANRGGAMLSWHDCHHKGHAILATGPDFAKITQSVCIELATDADKRQAQIKANVELCEASGGQLARPTGQERYLSLGSSHLTQFCKAVENNAKTSHSELSKLCQGVLSLDACTQGHGPDSGFSRMISQGWKRDCLAAEVEVIFPDLPLLIQQALSSSHITQSSGNEVEAMFHIASHFEATKSLPQAVQLAMTTRPPCLPYMSSVSNFVQNYSGGPSFPIVKILAHVSRSFQTSLSLGQEFTECVSQLDFKEPSSTFPWLRAASFAANLASPHSKDNIGRSISKSDVEKLRHPSQRSEVLQAEKQLQVNFELLKAQGDHETNLGLSCQARAMSRTILYLTKRQGKGHENHHYDSLAEIAKAFGLEMQKLHAGLQSVFSLVSFHEDTMDAAKICLKRTAMQIGQYYKQKGEAKLWKFVELDHEKAHFHHQPLFSSGEELEVLTVPHEELKNFKLAPGDPPQLVATDDMEPLLPQNSQTVEMEQAKAKASLLLFQTYSKCSSWHMPDASSLVWATKGAGLFANSQHQKLTLVPYGTMSTLKDPAKQTVSRTSCVVSGPNATQFQVSAPKLDLEKVQGLAVPFFHVGQTTESDLVNMEAATINVEKHTIPCYRNKRKLQAGDQLLVLKPEEDTPDKAKETKKDKKEAKAAKKEA